MGCRFPNTCIPALRLIDRWGKTHGPDMSRKDLPLGPPGPATNIDMMFSITQRITVLHAVTCTQNKKRKTISPPSCKIDSQTKMSYENSLAVFDMNANKPPSKFLRYNSFPVRDRCVPSCLNNCVNFARMFRCEITIPPKSNTIDRTFLLIVFLFFSIFFPELSGAPCQ